MKKLIVKLLYPITAMVFAVAPALGSTQKSADSSPGVQIPESQPKLLNGTGLFARKLAKATECTPDL